MGSMKSHFRGRPIQPRNFDLYSKRVASGCVEWIGSRLSSGYGIIRPTGEKAVLAHRFSYMRHVGEIPVGLCVLHRCDNPSCVNPEHLFLGTHRDNMADMSAKKRRSGGRNHKAILTNDIVQIVKAWMSTEALSLALLAAPLGVSKSALRHIKAGRHWID